MSADLNFYLPAPTKQRFAATFRVVRRISFGVQLALLLAASTYILYKLVKL